MSLLSKTGFCMSERFNQEAVQKYGNRERPTSNASWAEM
jgi:hypothetical protein